MPVIILPSISQKTIENAAKSAQGIAIAKGPGIGIVPAKKPGKAKGRGPRNKRNNINAKGRGQGAGNVQRWKNKPMQPKMWGIMRPAFGAVEGAGILAFTTTCDVYYTGNTPPAAPDVASVDIVLRSQFDRGSEASEGDQDFRWTHVLECPLAIDIRDTWPALSDTRVYVPDKDGVRYDIVFVEVRNRGRANAFKRAYLDRNSVTWPSDDV